MIAINNRKQIRVLYTENKVVWKTQLFGSTNVEAIFIYLLFTKITQLRKKRSFEVSK